MINSKQKGSRRERELAKILVSKGFEDAHRTQQFCGNTGDDASDVVGLPYIHIECKGTNVTSFYDFMNQAKRDSAKKKTEQYPVVFYKRDNKPWLVIMNIDDWFIIYNEFLKNKKEK